jgi:HEAT repeat protein
MRTHQAGRAAGRALLLSGLAFSVPAAPAYSAPPAPLLAPAPAQVSFEQAIADLASPDAAVRLRTARMLTEAAYPESALPLAKLVADPDDSVQLEAIAAELNIFITDKIVPRKRVGFIIEKRSPVAAETIFSSGPLAVGPAPVPVEVLDALRAAGRDDNPRVRLEATYAFGVLAVEPAGNRRRDLLRTSAPDLAAMISAVDPAHRFAAIRVIGRVLERRLHDEPIPQRVSDTVIGALNEKDAALQVASMQALGAMRDARAVPALIDLFQFHRKGGLAESALDAAARIGDPSAAALLFAQMESKNTAFKVIAIEGLARIGDRGKLTGLQDVVGKDSNASVQLAGSFASVMLADAGVAGVARLVEALQNPRLREQARAYLIELAPGRAAEFARYLQDPDPLVRTTVVDALGLSDDGAALAVVERIAADGDVQVARAVERAVARLRQTAGDARQ